MIAVSLQPTTKHDPPTKEIIMDEEYTKMEQEQMIMDYWKEVMEREQEYGD